MADSFAAREGSGRSVSHRVLVIDDDSEFREALSELLQDEGFYVRTATHAASAIRELEEVEFDVVLSDLVMPGNGHLVVEYVRKHQPNTPVIVISSHESPGNVLAASDAEAFACLRKPVRFHEIRETLTRALEVGGDGSGNGSSRPA